MVLRLRVISERRLIAEDGARVDADVASDVAVASENRIPDARLAADATIGPDHGAADDGVFVDLRLAADHGVRANRRSSLHQHTLIEETRPLDRGAVFDLRVRRHPC